MTEKLSIPKISKNPDIQKLLHQLDANGDGHIEKKEVDENGDGFLDCNQATSGWLYPKFGPVEKALFDSGLVAKLKNAVCWSRKITKTTSPEYRPSPKSPYYLEEKKVDVASKKGQPGTPMSHIPIEKAKTQSPKGIWLVPDSHGDKQRLQFLVDTVRARKVDWLALEMIPHTHQKWLDQFMKYPVNSPQFAKAKSELDNVLDGWESKFKDGLKPYHDLLLSCKRSGVRVYGMDCSSEYHMQSPMSDKLVVGTRNLIWAKQVPTKGKGIVFGGYAHFQGADGIQVQDFLRARFPKRSMEMIDF